MSAQMDFHWRNMRAFKRSIELGMDPSTRGAPLALLFITDSRVKENEMDAAIISYQTLLSAEVLGLKTCYFGAIVNAFPFSRKLKKTLRLPKHRVIVTGLLLGYTKLRFRRLVSREHLKVVNNSIAKVGAIKMKTIASPRLLVIGAGVNGSICAAALHKAGFDVTVLARGKRFEEVKGQGIILEDVFQNARSITPVAVINELTPDDLYDYILVVVRKNQVADLLPTLACNQTPNVVFMTNNPSGPDEWTRALGKERVLMGFVFGAGRREGGVIRGITNLSSGLAGRLWPSPFGELDGSISERLQGLIAIFRQAGLAAAASTHISDYLATHAALVAVLGNFVMARGYDHDSLKHYPLADIRLLVDAMREGLDVLTVSGVRITPAGTAIIKIIPRWILVAAIRALLPSRFMEVGGVYHISQAPDEIEQLVIEENALVNKSRLSVPAIRSVLEIGKHN
jgi:2-dehydropantoate 2-reductase